MHHPFTVGRHDAVEKIIGPVALAVVKTKYLTRARRTFHVIADHVPLKGAQLRDALGVLGAHLADAHGLCGGIALGHVAEECGKAAIKHRVGCERQ